MTAILLILTVFPLAAATGFTYATEASGSYYASIPHFEDELPFRSSGASGVLASPIGYSFPPLSISLNLFAYHVSDSLYYGSYIARGFWDFGISLRFSREIGRRTGVFFGGGTSFSVYDRIEEGFVSFSLFGGPYLVLADWKKTRLDLTFPVSVHLRKEITALTVGIGLRLGFWPEGGIRR